MFIEGQTRFWITKRTWNEFNPQQTSQNRLLFIEIHTLPPSMPYKKWKEISDLVHKTTNWNSQGTNNSPQKVPFELKDNSKHSICLAYPSFFFYLHFARSPSMASVLIFVQRGSSFCSLWRGSGHRALDGRSVCISSFPRVRMVTWIPRFGRNWRTCSKQRRRG